MNCPLPPPPPPQTPSALNSFTPSPSPSFTATLIAPLSQVSPCHDFLAELLETLLAKKQSSLVAPDKALKEPYTAPAFTEPPHRRSDINFTAYSWVLQHNLTCYSTAPCQYRTPSDCPKGMEGVEDAQAGMCWQLGQLLGGRNWRLSLQLECTSGRNAYVAMAASQREHSLVCCSEDMCKHKHA